MRRLTRVFTANDAENATIYIHLSKDWPANRWTDSDLPDRLAAVRHRQGRLLGRLEALGFELRTEAVFRALIEDVLKTSGSAFARAETTLGLVLAKARFWVNGAAGGRGVSHALAPFGSQEEPASPPTDAHRVQKSQPFALRAC